MLDTSKPSRAVSRLLMVPCAGSGRRRYRLQVAGGPSAFATVTARRKATAETPDRRYCPNRVPVNPSPRLRHKELHNFRHNDGFSAAAVYAEPDARMNAGSLSRENMGRCRRLSGCSQGDIVPGRRSDRCATDTGCKPGVERARFAEYKHLAGNAGIRRR